MILFNKLPKELEQEKVLLKAWLKQIIRNEEFEPGNVQYVFCNDEELLKVNLQFLQHDTYTDIITFDFCEGKLVSGEIHISEERVRENAILQQTNLNDEMLRVIAHGVLHLCGYKDKSVSEAQVMRQKEEEAILLLKNIKRE